MAVEFLLRRIESGGRSHQFRVYVPPHYEDDRAWPAVLFLHGAGERGNDSIGPTRVGIGSALQERAEPYPAIVVFPQCPAESHWALPEPREDALAALDSLRNEFNMDNARIALTGISMGGNGAWLMAADYPNRFTALAPVCGWLTRSATTAADVAQRLAHIPIWMFHGEADEIVPVHASRIMNTALRAAGADVRYTELAGVGHNSWDDAYRSPLMEWLISA